MSTINRKEPPFSDKLPVFNFPTIEEAILPNGIKIYFVLNKSNKLASVRISNRLENLKDRTEGLNYSVMNMLTRGTTKRSFSKIANQTDYIGASIFSSVHWDDAMFSLSVLDNFIVKGIEIFEDCFFNSIFTEADFKSFKERQLSMIIQEQAENSYVAQTELLKSYSTSLYASSLIGSTDSINTIHRNTCFDFYNNEVLTARKHIIVTGSVNPSKIIKRLENFNFNINTSEKSEDEIVIDLKNEKPELIMVDKKDANQVVIKASFRTIGSDHKDYPELYLANVIFGGYFLSKLNEQLREKMGLTYGISSYLDTRKRESFLNITTSVSKENSVVAANEILRQINIMKNEPISETDLKRGKQYMLGTFSRITETANQQALILQSIIINQLPMDYYNKFYETVKISTPESLFEVQSKYFSTENLHMVLVGDVKNISKEQINF